MTNVTGSQSPTTRKYQKTK